MTIIRVLSDVPQAVNPGPLRVYWQSTGVDERTVRLNFDTVATHRPAQGVERLSQGVGVISALPEAIEAVIKPTGLPRFPDGSRIDLQLRSADGHEFAMPPVNVSGTSLRTLFTLTPGDGVWTLMSPSDRREDQPVLRTAADFAGKAGGATVDVESLPALSRSAAYRVRELAGPRGTVPSDLRAEMHVALDVSASMLPYVRSGARRTALEVLLGVNAEAGLRSRLPVWQVGHDVRAFGTALAPHTIGGYDEYIGLVPHTGGTVVAPLVRTTSTDEVRRLVVIVADGVPADLDALRMALVQATAHHTTTRWHLLAFGRSRGDPAVEREPWRDELAPLSTLGSNVFSYSSVTPGGGADWLDRRLRDEATGKEAMARVVSGICPLGGPTA